MTTELDISKTFPAIGNHEYRHHSSEEWLSFYNINSTYYSVSNDFIKVIIIDTEFLERHEFDKFYEQKQFIIDELKNNTSDFEIIVMHRPMISDVRTVEEYGKELQSIFDKYDVELVIQGHNHYYQRYEPRQFNDGPIPEQFHVRLFEAYTQLGASEDNGQMYLTVGTGGKNMPSSGKLNELLVFLTGENKITQEPGILLLEVDEMKVVGQFITNDNRVLDEFEVHVIESYD